MSNDRMIFSIVPIDVWLDKRLRLETVRVLGALLSFRGKDTNTVWPTRHSIAERCGLPPAKISEATSELMRLGWLKKDGRGGFSKATRYTIVVPRIVTDSVTIPQSVTVTEKGTGGVPQSVTRMPVPQSVRGKELTNNKPEELTNKVAQVLPASASTKSKLNGAECSAIIKYLNEKSGSNFRLVDTTKKLIQARFNEGATFAEMKQVIDQKTVEWKPDPKMAKYLRPDTLFNATKYSSYAGQLRKTKSGADIFGGCV